MNHDDHSVATPYTFKICLVPFHIINRWQPSDPICNNIIKYTYLKAAGQRQQVPLQHYNSTDLAFTASFPQSLSHAVTEVKQMGTNWKL